MKKNYFKQWISKKLATDPALKFQNNFTKLNIDEYNLLKRTVLDICEWEEIQNSISAQNHLIFERLKIARNFLVPWISSVRRISDIKILEIGCGTGPAMVALAEQGGDITGIDVSERMLKIASQRLKLHKVRGNLVCCNAENIEKLFKKNYFDLIIFKAVLEHMTLEEKIVSLKSGWNILPKGGLLCITGSPNRLWHFDYHSSGLHFFNWLPDDLAKMYSINSKRKSLWKFSKACYRDDSINFQRYGRSISFHEVDIAIGDTSEIKVISSAEEFRKKCRGILKYRGFTSVDNKYKKLLNKFKNTLHSGFFERVINIIIEK